MAKLVFQHAGQEGISPALAAILTKVGEQFGRDVNVLSGYRSPEYNAAVGGAKQSYHTHGKASDVSLAGMNDQQRASYVQALIDGGVGGLITYSKHPDMLHVDLRDRVAGRPVFMHDKSSRYMASAPEWFRQLAGGSARPEAMQGKLSEQPDLIGGVLAAAQTPTPMGQGGIGSDYAAATRAPTAPPSADMVRSLEYFPLAPTPGGSAPAGPPNILGGLLAGAMKSLSGGQQGQQADPIAMEQARAEQAREAALREAQDVAVNSMPTTVGQIDLAMLPERTRVAARPGEAPALNRNDILASILGPGVTSIGRSIVG